MHPQGIDPALVVHQSAPLNAEPPLASLGESFITPAARFFIRNHASVPEIDPAEYHLNIVGLVKHPVWMTLGNLKRDFKRRTVVAALQCAGNRRGQLADVAPIHGEVLWGGAAVGTAAWTGASLRDVLKAVKPKKKARHVEFTGQDAIHQDGDLFGFGGSIPLDAALDPDVLLAYDMNGEPLLPEHGFPLRLVVPGYIGARSVKWLGEINLRAEPSDNYFQTHAYRLFPSHVSEETADWSQGMMLGEFPVNSVIVAPEQGARLLAGEVLARGFALSGGGRRVERVDVSADSGATWHTAELLAQDAGEHRHAWRFWQARLALKPGVHELVVRAWDSAANTQPERAAQVWNFKGYANNAWHRVHVWVE